MMESFLQSAGVLGENDKVIFKSLLDPWVILAVTLIIVALVILFYQRTSVTITGRYQSVLIALKLLPLLLITCSLLEPVLLTSEVTPEQGFIIVLMDDSKSMRIQDAPGSVSRIEAVRQLMEDDKGRGLLPKLKEKFRVRTFRFSLETNRIADQSELTAEGEATDISGALSQVSGEFRDMPLAGIVLVSDGADNADQGVNELAGVAAYLKSQEVPVYTIGIGKEHVLKDIEIMKVATSKTMTAGSVADLFVTLRGYGYQGKTVDLEIKEGARLVETRQVLIGRDGDTQRIKLTLAPDAPGIYEYSAEIKPRSEEMISENNQRRFLVDNRTRKGRVLYVEGYPRKEFKFIRRSVDEDPQVNLVSMVRISHDGRLYRQGVQSPTELQDGYPRTREELFGYDAIILGNIEAAWFTPEQLQMTEEFVSIRGGGLLMLGGDGSFAEGGYAGTPVEDALPVRVASSRGGGTWGIGLVDRIFRMDLTPDGRTHPLMRISPDRDANAKLWSQLPELAGYNRVGDVKPGATVLGIDPSADLLEGSNVILVVQRYGEGRTMAFTSASTWRWQMFMDSEDDSHERFWQQMVRWLALASTNRISVTLNKETYVENEPVVISSRVLDETFKPVNDASVWAQVTGPTGQPEPVELEWTFGDDGSYQAEYMPRLGGMHRVDVSVRTPQTFIAVDQGGFSVAESVAEFTDASLHADVLKRLASSTGGDYLEPAQAGTLPDLIPPVKQTSSLVREEDLRDTPPLFIAVLLFLGLEWFLRRRKGLA